MDDWTNIVLAANRKQAELSIDHSITSPNAVTLEVALASTPLGSGALAFSGEMPRSGNSETEVTRFVLSSLKESKVPEGGWSWTCVVKGAEKDEVIYSETGHHTNANYLDVGFANKSMTASKHPRVWLFLTPRSV